MDGDVRHQLHPSAHTHPRRDLMYSTCGCCGEWHIYFAALVILPAYDSRISDINPKGKLLVCLNKLKDVSTSATVSALTTIPKIQSPACASSTTFLLPPSPPNLL